MFFSKPKKSPEEIQAQFNLAADCVFGHQKDAKAVLQRINMLKAEIAMLEALELSDQPLELETNTPFQRVKLQNTTMCGHPVVRMIKEEW